MATLAIHTSTASTTLAVALVLSSSRGIDDIVEVALFGLDDLDAVAVSLLHTLALVSTIAVAAGRHVLSFEAGNQR
ncbi:hypothetical protein, partial [Vibrio anguillarum]|uniref:hypothetical protein n=1 Tax=Vibrio anguillarum TaxID=55601 RepID=UPI001C05DF37